MPISVAEVTGAGRRVAFAVECLLGVGTGQDSRHSSIVDDKRLVR